MFSWFKQRSIVQGSNVIVPQYEVPDGLSPMEVGAIVNGEVNSRSISAELIYLATRGYIKIRQIENTGIVNAPDYVIIKLKDISDIKNTADQVLFCNIFPYELVDAFDVVKPEDVVVKADTVAQSEDSISLSGIEKVFNRNIPLVVQSVSNTLVREGYFEVPESFLKNKILRTTVSALFIFLLYSSQYSPERFMLPLIILCFTSVLVTALSGFLSPRFIKTEKGNATEVYLLGLQEYLQIAEKDRLAFHNAPEKKPEIFEKLLPYAMVLGIDKAWTKEFEGVYTMQPIWYEGVSEIPFSMYLFNESFCRLNISTSVALGTAPTDVGISSEYNSGGISFGDGGSGGGGFSGGGGGGGGGGSW